MIAYWQAVQFGYGPEPRYQGELKLRISEIVDEFMSAPKAPGTVLRWREDKIQQATHTLHC
jgi:ketol-acid reductoisomerase